MISLVRQKAAALAHPPRFESRTESAENLAAPEDSFDLDVGPVPEALGSDSALFDVGLREALLAAKPSD